MKPYIMSHDISDYYPICLNVSEVRMKGAVNQRMFRKRAMFILMLSFKIFT